MDYSKHTFEQLIGRITEIEMFNKELLAEKEQQTRLDFAWSGNLKALYVSLMINI